MRSTRSRRWSRVLSGFVLALQMVGAGAVALAHAREAPTAPAAIEAQHDARCVVVHDALRCAVCHAAVPAAPPLRRVSFAPLPTVVAPATAGPDRHTPRCDVLISAPPRAPPAALS
jgi:uncharacterized membrane protein